MCCTQKGKQVKTSLLKVAAFTAALVVISSTVALAAIAQPDFRDPEFYKAGPGPFRVVTGDFNEDGEPDLVTGNRFGDGTNGGDISCLPGNADGTFDAATGQDLTASTLSLNRGDLDGDGNLDLVVTDPDSSPPSVVVLLGNGDCTFTENDTEDSGGTGGFDPFETVVANLDGDEPTEVAVTNQETNNVRIFENDGAGDLTEDDTIELGSGTGPNGVAAGDVDRDGDRDLAVALSGTGDVTLLENRGRGGFIQDRSFNMANGEAGSPSPILVTDLNSDGRLDIATGNVDQGDTDQDFVAVRQGRGDGSFGATAFYRSGGDSPLSLTFGDYNGDGRKDIAAANQFSNTSGVNRGNVGVLTGRGDATFTGTARFDAGDGPFGLTDGRYNGDERVDLATSNFGAGGPDEEDDTVSVLINRTPAR